MSNELALRQDKEIQVAETLGIEVDVYRALKNSLFPDAKDESIGMYLAYCRAKGYDPLKKPMHIVPIGVKTGKKDEKGKDIYENRDVIMPGIISYRIDAVRTGTFYGISDAEFGPMITKKLGQNNLSFEYPEWCRVVIYKMIGDAIREIPAKLYFMECYSTISAFSDEPNRMWKKRPRAMLEKCCEALAFRRGFPEETGGIPTMDEMEGRQTIDDLPGERDITPEAKALENQPLAHAYAMNEELLTKHLDVIRNCLDKKLLIAAYNAAKKDADGDMTASNEISLATKERQDYLNQLKQTMEQPKPAQSDDWGKQYDESETK